MTDSNIFATKLNNETLKLAKEQNHKWITLEHLLLSIINIDLATFEVFHSLKYDSIKLECDLKKFLQSNNSIYECNNNNDTPIFMPEIVELGKCVLKNLEDEKRKNLTGIDYIIAICKSNHPEIISSFAYKLLKNLNIDFRSLQNQLYVFEQEQFKRRNPSLQIINTISTSNSNSTLDEDERKRIQLDELEEAMRTNTAVKQNSSHDLNFLINLFSNVKKHSENLAIGRADEINQIAQILIRKKKNNPILVGDAGVGKTAIVEGLTQLLNNNKLHLKLNNFKVYQLDLQALLSDTGLRGTLEKRLTQLVKFFSYNPYSILFIDEIHTIMGAGATNGSSMDIANFLKPYMTNGTIKIIGATTHKEFRYLEKDPAMIRRVSVVNIKEPSKDDTIKILEKAKLEHQAYYNIKIESQTIEYIVTQCLVHIPQKRFPDKALELLDGALAYQMINYPKARILNNKIVNIVLSKQCNLPIENIEQDINAKILNLETKLNESVLGQKEAISECVEQIQLAYSGLKDTNDKKPIMSALFLGSTGVGKTELCKALESALHCPLLKLDMSEYNDETSVNSLIGSAPGYVGSENGGFLTEYVSKNPSSIILFDEVEKSHPAIWDLLLQVMDDGSLTDKSGKRVSFENCIIVCTSNLEQTSNLKQKLGLMNDLTVPKKSNNNIKESLKNTFRPELVNRFSNIIKFNDIEKSVASKILENKLKKIPKILKDNKGITINLKFNDESFNFLLNLGYNKADGVRPLNNIIEKEIKKKLSNLILKKEIDKIGSYNVFVKINNESLELIASKKNEKKVA